MSRMWDLDDLIATKQIAALLQVSQPTVSNWQRRAGVGFPKPLLSPSGYPLFSRVQVLAWHERWVREHS